MEKYVRRTLDLKPRRKNIVRKSYIREIVFPPPIANSQELRSGAPNQGRRTR